MSRNTMAGMGFVEDMRTDEDEGDFPAGDNTKGIKRFYGKYRGTVLPIPDPDRRGRLMVQVSDVNGPNINNWARPCLPWGGITMGAYIVPAAGSKVWVEFEQGHPDKPIWVGCWWGTVAETPTIAKLSLGTPILPIFALESLFKHGFVVTDAPFAPHLPSGGILIGNATAGIAIDVAGVRIYGPVVHINGVPGDLSGVSAALLVV